MSQCQQILQVLSDGREHEMRDIHREVGFCRLNSRVAELRSRGHEITCRRAGGSYFYRLVLNEAAGVVDSPLASAASLSTSASNQAPLEAADSISGRDGAGVLTHSSPHRPAARTAPCRGADPGSIPGAGVLTLFEATA